MKIHLHFSGMLDLTITFLLVFCCAGASFAGPAILVTPAEKTQSIAYHESVLASIPYGDAFDQIGLLNEESLLAGPESFWVTGDGMIYILDTVQSKIKVIEPSGGFQKAIDFDGIANDIAVDAFANIYIFEHRSWQIHQLNPTGREMAVFNAKLAGIEVPRNLRFSNHGLMLSDSEQNEYTLGQVSNSGLSRPVDTHLQKQIGLHGANGKRIKAIKNENETAEITLADANSSRVTQTWIFNRKKVASVEYIGEDGFGNLYLQVESFKNFGMTPGVDLNLYCLNSSGKIIGSIEKIPNNYNTWTAKLLQVNNNGDIYQMLPTETEVIIRVWKKIQ